MKKETAECHHLSPRQRQLWAQGLGSFDLTHSAQCLLLMGGRLDRSALKGALQEVIDRHEILRTNFHMPPDAEEPVQVVADCGLMRWEEHDFCGGAAVEQHRALDILANEIRRLPFDLSSSAAVGADLITLSPAEHALVLTLPALCADRVTLKVLTSELGRAYVSNIRGGEGLDEPVPYTTFSEIFTELLNAEEAEAGRSYWRALDLSALHSLSVPFETARREPRAFDPRRITVTIGPELYGQIPILAAEGGADPYTVLLACWQTLLWRLNSQEEVIVGAEFDCRDHEELADALGPFAKCLPVRTSLKPRLTFMDVLKRVAESAREAQDWHDYFAWEFLPGQKRMDGGVPFFPYCFELDEGGGREAAADLVFEVRRREVCSDRYKIKLTARPYGGLLLLDVHYDASLYAEEDASRLAGQFEKLLGCVALAPETPIDEIEITTERELSLFAEWNRTTREYPGGECMHELFEAQAARSPGEAALVCGSKRLSYGELNRRANRLAHYLTALGVGPEVRVGVLMERSAEMVVSLLAVLKAGGAYVPLDPEYPAERLSFMIEDSDMAVLLTQERLKGQLAACGAEVVYVDVLAEKLPPEPMCDPAPVAGPGNLAYLIYTSGSTGRPKGVAIEHRNVATFLRWSGEVFGREELRGVLASTSICFDLSVFEIFAPLSWGGKIILAADALALTGLEAADEVTLINTVPSAMAELVRARRLPTGVRTVNLAGEPLLNRLAQRVYSAGAVERVINLYGPSEDTTYSTCGPVTKGSERAPTIGRPIANTRAHVLDERMRPAALGMVGELYIGGDGLARGYLNRPELTAEKFIPDPFSKEPGARLYRTGDLARWLPDGELEFLGRVDQQVKVRGYRIELGEVEACLRSHPSVHEAVVVVRGRGGVNALAAYVVARGGAESPEPAALREHLRRSLPEYMFPSSFTVLDSLPLTPNGKVDRKALPEPDAAQAAREYVAPRTPAEEVVASAWAEVLGVERVGADDNFFELGGHSLLAAQVVSRLQQAFNLRMAVRDLFEHQTVARLAHHIAGARRNIEQAAPPIVPAGRDRELPLSFAQQRLWFIDQLEPGNTLYNMPVAVRLEGRLDVDALKRALSEVVRRHEVLRTTFACVGGRPLQLIRETPPFDLPVEQLSSLSEADRESRVRQIAEEEATAAFNLSTGPLVRARLLRLSEEEHVLVVVMHHIVSDGWSMGLLVKEVSALYEAYTEGRESPLSELPIQYADYALWQREWLQGEVLERQLSYWRSRLEGAPTLELPTDRPRPAKPSRGGAGVEFELGGELSERLRQLSRAEGATLFMTLLAAFQLLLSRYSGQEDVVVGTPVAGRSRAEVEGLIGCFVNTLVLRTDLSGEVTFSELLGRVRETCLGAYAHQDVPFERLVEELKPGRDLGRNPLFQVMFALQNAPAEGLRLAGLSFGAGDVGQGPADFDLGLAMVEANGGIRGKLAYNTELFDEATIRRLIGHYELLLRTSLEQPGRSVRDIELLTDEERAQLIQRNETPARHERDVCVHELFERRAGETPDAVAVVYGVESLSYGELNRRANRLAHYLTALGVGPEVRVGVLMERSAEMVVSLLAVLKAGGAYVPLDPEYPAERLSFMIEDSEASVLLTHEALCEKHSGWLSGQALRVACLDGERKEAVARDSSNPARSVLAENLAYVIYTSGSTGWPKGALITHEGISNAISNAVRLYEARAESRVLQVASQGFDASLKEIFLALTTGGSLHIASAEQRLSGPELSELIKGESITTAVLTPSTLGMLNPNELPGLKVVSTGGESCGGPTATAWANDRLLLNCYGPTETSVFVTCAQCLGNYDKEPPIGRPIANVEIYILDEAGRRVAPGVVGEIHVGGVGLARGYLRRPAATAERFVPHPFSSRPGARLYRTGDLGRYLPDGQIEFRGRRDGQVKVRGFRIELGEVEAKLRLHPRVSEAAVVARGEGEARRLVAYVTGRGGEAPAAAELRAHLIQLLPAYMAPAAFVTLSEMPQTGSGKLDRAALPDPAEAYASAPAGSYIAPRDRLEVRLALMWEELLGVRPVGISDNFFESGGHSLLAVQLAARIRQELGTEFSLASIFPDINIERLARILRERSTRAVAPSLIGLQTAGTKTPFFCLHPALGLSLCYMPLARLLDPLRPFYGFHAPGMDDDSEPLADARLMAARYIEELKAVQPEGPYLLGGYSLGGTVAYEMAQQLRDAGQEVAALVMLDAGVLYNDDLAELMRGRDEEDDGAELLERALRDFCHLPADRLRGLAPQERLDYALGELQKAGHLPADFKAEQLGRWLEVYRATTRAWMVDYRPQPYDGEVIVLRTLGETAEDADADPTLGWGRLAAGGVRVLDAPGSHQEMIYEPHVRELAAKLRSLLDEAEARATRRDAGPLPTTAAAGLHLQLDHSI